MRSNIISKCIIWLFLPFLTSCAQRARDLPPDLGHLPPSQRLLQGDEQSSEYHLSCDDLTKRIVGLSSDIRTLEESLLLVQATNFKVTLSGLFFTPALLTLNNASETKQKLDEVHQHKEKAIRIFQAKCETH